MSALFDTSLPEVVACFDDASVWSSLAGNLLLRRVPLVPGAALLDLGCGTGFPLIELAERLGPGSRVVGVDPWAAAAERARLKARVRGLANVEVFTGDLSALPAGSGEFDLVTANLVLNNVKDPEVVLRECARLMRPGGTIALASNLRGTMSEIDDAFLTVLRRMGLREAVAGVEKYANHRCTAVDMESWLRSAGFEVTTVAECEECLRFSNGTAFLGHYFIRLAFLDGWMGGVAAGLREEVLRGVEAELNRRVSPPWGLSVRVPLAYVEATARSRE